MIGKSRDGGPMKPIALRLPPDLQDDLKDAAGNRGLGEEIRRRLEASLELDKIDEKTRTLSGLMMYVAAQIGPLFGEWHEDPFAFQVFKSAVNTLLSQHEPSGDPVYKPDPNKLGDMFCDIVDGPEKIGRRIAQSRAMDDAMKSQRKK